MIHQPSHQAFVSEYMVQKKVDCLGHEGSIFFCWFVWNVFLDDSL